MGLADAVRELRRELTEAMAAGEDEPLRFELGPIEVEFALTLRRNGEGSAGANFVVVSIGAKAGMSSETLHRLKLTLNPQEAESGRPAKIAGHVDRIPPG
jgi:hypothetical protein